ncbi:MAG TPA: hypothetical protein VK447_02970 [Myxococcaceae bacterium]|nr:hypothetical protein [Myxococcaceae bacterium]
MYSERFSLPFLAEVLIASAERARPGLGAWSEKTRQALESSFRTELSEVRARFFEIFDDQAHWEKVERNLLEVCFPRYCAVAEKQTALEQNDYGLWRGGDLVARGAYIVLGLFVGIFLVRAPFFRLLPTTWDFLIVLLMILAPFVPDAQIALKQRRFTKQLQGIVADMAQAEAQQKLYQPLTPERPLAEGMSKVEELSPQSDRPPEPADRTRNER